MSDLTLSVATAEVPENLECVVSNERWQELVALLSVIVPAGMRLNIGSTTPAPEDRIYPWLRLDSNGKPDRLYYYAMGFWLAKYHTPASSPERRIWTGSTTDLLTYDEGENTAVSETSGPFWEVDPDWAQRIPIGVGTLPTSGAAVALNTDYGKDQYTLQTANFQRHRHWVAANQTTNGASQPTSTQQIADDAGGAAQENYIFQGTGTVASVGRSSFVLEGSQSDGNEAFSILNPVRGTYFIKRTVRNYFRQAA